MKKYLCILSSLLLGLVCLTSCNKDDDEVKNAKSYLTVQNATYYETTLPAATTKSKLTNVSVSGLAKPGGIATIKVVSNRPYKRFFVGVKGVNGYWTYTPANSSSQKQVKKLASSNDDEYNYEIPINLVSDNNSSFTTLLSAEDEEGEITEPYEEEINMVDITSGGRVTSIFYQGQEISVFKYDGEGRMISASAYDVLKKKFELLFEISYNPLKIISNDEGDKIEFNNISINNDGFITNMTATDEYGTLKIENSYDDQGHLIKSIQTEKDSEGTWRSDWNYTWSNGNLVKIEANIDNGEEVYESSATYGDYLNHSSQWTASQDVMFWDPSSLEWSGLFGNPSFNLPIKTIDMDGDTLTWTYTYNEDFTIKTEISNGIELQYNYGGYSTNRISKRSVSTRNNIPHLFHHRKKTHRKSSI